MADLNALHIFAKVVEAATFSEAARRLKMPVSTVSRRVAELEDELGVRLLERSTRALRLTDVGADVLTEARRTADIAQSVRSIVAHQAATITGALSLAAPPSISDSLISPIVSAFQAEHPGLRVEIKITERAIDPIAEGIDLIFHVGPLSDTSMIAHRILRFRHQLVRSPDYRGAANEPRHPRDLLQHRILAFSHFRPEYSWTFHHVNGADRETVTFQPHLAINDFTGITAALLAGGGIGDLSPLVQPELMRQGRLVEVLTDWRFPSFDLSLIHLAQRHLPRPVRIFKEFAAEMAPRLFPDLPN